MSKELEALKLVRFHESFGNNGMFEEEYQLIEKALKENEALKSQVVGLENTYDKLADKCEKYYKALEIIKNKQVDVGWFIKCYNDYSNDKDRLMMYNQLSIDDKGRSITQEEFDLLKEELQ